MKKILVIATFFALSNTCFSQKLEQVAKNQLDDNIVVFTYKVKGYQNQAIEDNSQNSLNNQNYSKHFLKYNGVTKSRFDAATGLITVYANITTVIQKKIKLTKTK